jgi:hypothetical protein
VDLQQFVTSVLTQLDAAVSQARADTQRDIRFQASQGSRTVEFDVAVTVESEKSKEGGAKLEVAGFWMVGGHLGGGMTDSAKEPTVSRVRFGVHIEPLTKDEQAARDRRNEEAMRRSRAEQTGSY